MASPDTSPNTSNASRPVLAPPGDPKGFSHLYQMSLRIEIIRRNVGPIMNVDSQPTQISPPTEEIPTFVPGPEKPQHTTDRGIVRTHIAPNLITSNDQSAQEREAQRKREPA